MCDPFSLDVRLALAKFQTSQYPLLIFKNNESTVMTSLEFNQCGNPDNTLRSCVVDLLMK